MLSKTEECQRLFDSIPIETTLKLKFNLSYSDIIGEIVKKVRHNAYSYSLFLVNRDDRTGGFFWIKPDYIDYFGRKVIDFEIISKEEI